MLLFRIRYLLLSSCFFFIQSCTPAYKQMQAASGNAGELKKFKPAFSVVLYNTAVDVAGNHLSGLLLIKKMPDSSTRIVFSNEIGFKFFDFEFSSTGGFKVYSVIKQMNKKPVLKTLQKDFELILMERLENAPLSIHANKGLIYYVFPQSKGFNFYITDSTRGHLIRIERASKNKTIAEAIMKDYVDGIPASININHTTFNFVIGLNRIEK